MPAKKWSKEIVVRHILELHDRGERLTSGNIQDNHGGLFLAAYRYCGNWRKAIEAAGLRYQDISLLEVRIRQALTADEVIATIRKMHHLGSCLSSSHIQKTQSRLYGRVMTHFGSWKKAIEAANLDYQSFAKRRITRQRKRGWWTKNRVILQIKRLEQQGKRLDTTSVQRSLVSAALFTAAVKHFGGWDRAVEAAGISYRVHTRVWSTKAWMNRMQEDEYTTTLKRAQTHARKRRSST